MRLLIAALVLALFFVQNRGPAELATAPVKPGAVRIAYGADPLQFGELRIPSTRGPHPVAIVIHGGCWVSELGKLDARAVAIDNMRLMAAAMSDAGIATWNVEYRRVGNPGGGWPGTYRDVAAAADKLRDLAKDHTLDLKRVLAIGHSAGGHLSLWLAARPKIAAGSEIYSKDPIRLTAVVNLDGPFDLKAIFDAQQQVCGRPVITDLMGGTPAEQPDRYQAASPAELLPIGVRLASFTGRLFGTQNEKYEAAAKAAGDTLRVTMNPTAGHFVFIDPESQVWPEILATVRELLSMGK